MQKELRAAGQAIDDLEYNLPDMADAVETEAEARAILNYCNRLAILINETRRKLQ
jgi:hypothetical protein